MSWFATGTIEGSDEGWSDSLGFSPSEDQLDPGPLNQTKFVRDIIGMAFEAGVLEGKYSCSINGHSDSNSRKSLSMSFSPVS
jgi:hypothetical protein